MEFISVAEFAEKYGLKERTVRNYCAVGKIKGATLIGKTWSLPCDAEPPVRNKRRHKIMPLLQVLRREKSRV